MPGIEQNVEAFLASLEDDVRRASERLQRNTKKNAPSFRAFALLDPKEVVQTRVIASLLNSFGTHGQGDTFLRLFLEKVKQIAPQGGMIDFAALLTPDNLREVEVVTEHLTRAIESDQRRIDLVVRLPQNNIIAIESKARGAKLQKNQLKDYCRHLKEIADHFLLIYLSAGELDPEEEVAGLCQEHPETIVKVPYREWISSWLDDCAGECCAEPVRQFLSDFKKYLSEKEEVPMDKTEMERITRAATQDEGKLRSALAVIDAQGEIGHVLGQLFVERLKSQIARQSDGKWAPEIEVEEQPTDHRKYISLILKLEHWGNMSVVFHLDGKMSEWAEQNGFGIRGEGKKTASEQPFDEKKLKLLELKHLPGGKKADNWRCYRVWRPREERMEDTALLLLNPPDTVINCLADKLVQLATDLDAVLRG